MLLKFQAFVAQLLDAKADVEQPSDRGSPLRLAAQAGNLEMCQKLLDETWHRTRCPQQYDWYNIKLIQYMYVYMFDHEFLFVVFTFDHKMNRTKEVSSTSIGGGCFILWCKDGCIIASHLCSVRDVWYLCILHPVLECDVWPVGQTVILLMLPPRVEPRLAPFPPAATRMAKPPWCWAPASATGTFVKCCWRPRRKWRVASKLRFKHRFKMIWFKHEFYLAVLFGGHWYF